MEGQVKISVRLMEPADVRDVVSIENSWSYLSKWGERGYLSVMSQPQVYTCLVAEESSVHKIVGLAVVAQLVDHCELCNLVVLPDYVSKGIGFRLLLQCLEVAHQFKIPRMLLEVRQSNQQALEFYKRNGFRAIGTRRNYYMSPCEDACVMERIEDPAEASGRLARSKS